MPAPAEVAGTRRSGVLGLALCAALCWGGPAGCKDDGVATDVAAPTAALGRLRLQWPLLQRVSYDLKLESTSTTTMPGPPFRLEVAARVELVPVEAQGARVAVLMRLREPKVTFGKVRLADGDSLEAELGKPFWFALEGGKVVDGRIADGVSAQAVSIFRTVSSSLQLALPVGQKATTWQDSELDATGRYEASYRVNPDGTSVSKHKLKFVETLISGKADQEHRAKVLPEVLRSRGELSVVAGLPQRITLSDELRSTLLGTNQVTVQNELSLVRSGGPEKVDPRSLKIEGELLALPPSQAFGEKEIRAQFDALRARGATFADVLSGLERLASAKEQPRLVGSINDEPLPDTGQEVGKAALEERASLLSKLTGLLRTQPATLEQAKQAILKPSSAAGALGDGLAMADTQASQAVLVALLQDARLAQRLRSTLAMSLIRVHSVSPATVDFLRSKVADAELKDHAVYGLGTAARRLREKGETARADAIASELLTGLQNAKSSKDRFRWLRGIANSASIAALPVVQPYLQDDDREVRQAALESLRLLRDPRVDGIVQDRLKVEKDPSVRRAAVRLAERQGVSDTLIAAVSLAAKSDADPTVRRAALLLLEQWLPRRESLRPLVEELKAAAARIDADLRKPDL